MSYVTIGRKLYNDMSAAYEREQTCEILPEAEANALREVAEYQRQLSGEDSIPGCYCRDCKWWKRYDKPMPQWEGWGYCQRVHEPASICLPDPETYELGIDAVETDTDVSTRGDFGCCQGETK